jgi:hypothetical protein
MSELKQPRLKKGVKQLTNEEVEKLKFLHLWFLQNVPKFRNVLSDITGLTPCTISRAMNAYNNPKFYNSTVIRAAKAYYLEKQAEGGDLDGIDIPVTIPTTQEVKDAA